MHAHVDVYVCVSVCSFSDKSHNVAQPTGLDAHILGSSSGFLKCEAVLCVGVFVSVRSF